jgi:uncharacterized protein YkwD
MLVVVALAAAPLAGGTTRSVQRDVTLEQSILREVNQLRASRGLRVLTVSRELQAAAAFQTKALLAQGVFDHGSDDGGAFSSRLRRYYPARDATSWSVGENLLWAPRGLTAPNAVRLWLNSPPHRKIMLDPTWREFGIGGFEADAAPGVYAESGAVVVVTLDFGARASSARALS